MILHVKGRNIEVSDAIRRYAETKLRKLERQLHDNARVELELAAERNPSIAANHVAEATIRSKGPVLRAREAASDPKAAIDQLVDKLERQVARYRARRRRRPPRGSSAALEAEAGSRPMVRETEPRIVKTKQFAVKPMSPDEAAAQLELIGHDFFVFRDAESSEVNILYRRRDGDYGLIEPQ